MLNCSSMPSPSITLAWQYFCSSTDVDTLIGGSTFFSAISLGTLGAQFTYEKTAMQYSAKMLESAS